MTETYRALVDEGNNYARARKLLREALVYVHIAGTFGGGNGPGQAAARNLADRIKKELQIQ